MTWVCFEGHTLDISHALLEDLGENLGALKLVGDLLDDGLGELGLFPLLDLGLISDPAVQNLFSLGSELGLLFQDESLRLKFGGFLQKEIPSSAFFALKYPSRSSPHYRTLETEKRSLVI